MKRPASENWLTRLLHWSAADTQTAEVAYFLDPAEKSYFFTV